MEDNKLARSGGKERFSASHAPGVYYDLFFERKVQPVFRTGIPVFVGFARWLGKETRHAPRILHLDRWPQFLHFQMDYPSYLAYAVRGFFENGGEHCVVVPIHSANHIDNATALLDVFKYRGILDDLEDVDLVCVPDAMAPDIYSASQTVLDIQAAALDHCQRMGDRFAILDGFIGQGDADSNPSVHAVKSGIGRAISHWQALPPECGALYYPWISVEELPSASKRSRAGEEMPCDAYLSSSERGTSSSRLLKPQPPKLVPPCGHIAGIYSRSDLRIGVHKAPANELIEDVFELEINYSEDELAALNDAGINCLRISRTGEMRNWGARTLSGQPQWTYVNVRRLFLTMTRWLRRSMNDVVYESNDPHLWNCIRQRLADYCRHLFDQGALKGNSPEQAFYVKCDAETNSREHWEAGEVVAELGLAPTVPLEFIVVRITQNASTTTVSG